MNKRKLLGYMCYFIGFAPIVSVIIWVSWNTVLGEALLVFIGLILLAIVLTWFIKKGTELTID